MELRQRLAEHLPMFALEVRTPRLVLRYPDDQDALALAELGARGVHDPDAHPFRIPWTSVPPPHQQRNTLSFLWDQRATAQRDDWHLPLVTIVAGEVVGTQDVLASSWSVLRQVQTGSWLGQAHQGKGIGSEMRAAVLHLAFAGFGAVRASTGAWEDNPSSLAVTRRLGYRPNGDVWDVRDGEAVRMHRFVLDRDDWEPTRRGDIELVGAEAVAELFGTERPPGS
ncbi:MAG TPA: GNAT family protein [Acidimicrobiales bacterium]|nr:GNAT family protein [Acidimicrobiales bacterium]